MGPLGATSLSILMGFFLLRCVSSQRDYISWNETEDDFLVGGIYPIHSYKDEKHGKILDYNRCDSKNLNPLKAILSEVHLWCIDHVNENFLNGTGITLGTYIVDSCYSPEIGFRRSIGFIENRTTNLCQSNVSHNFSREVSVVLGGMSNTVTRDINYLLQVFCIPFIASEATQSDFSDDDLFPLFLRTVPSDQHQANAIVAILKRFNWTHVAIVYDRDKSSLHTELTKNVNQDNDEMKEKKDNLLRTGNLTGDPVICVEWSFELAIGTDSTPDWDGLKNFVVKRKTMPPVIILLMDGIFAEDFFHHAESWGLDGNSTQIIGTDAWSSQINSSYTLIDSAICIQPGFNKKQCPKGMVQHLEQVSINSSKSPWLIELIQIQNGECCWTKNQSERACQNKTTCFGNEQLKPTQISDEVLNHATFVFQSLFLLGDTLRKLQNHLCPGTKQMCEKFKKLSGYDIYNSMRNNSVDASFEKFSFYNGTNSGPPFYNIVRFRRERNKTAKWEPIGFFDGTRPTNQIKWSTGSVFNVKTDSKWNFIKTATEKCYSTCRNGYPCMVETCCWICETCSKNPYSFVKISDIKNFTVADCTDCSDDQVPSEADNFRSCVQGVLQYISFDQPVFLVLGGITSLCIIATLLSLGVLMHFWNTPLVMASSPRVTFSLGVCLALLFATPGILMIPPTKGVCVILWMVYSYLITLCHVLVLAKSRHLQSHPTIKLGYCEVTSDSTLIGFVLLGHTIIALLWLVLNMPSMHYIRNDDKKRLGYYYNCSAMDEPETCLLMICPILILLSMLPSLHGSIRNPMTHVKHLEARRMIVATVALLADYATLIPLTFSFKNITKQDLELTVILLASTMIATGIVFLTLVLMPLAYFVLFHSKKNTKAFVRRVPMMRSRQQTPGGIVIIEPLSLSLQRSFEEDEAIRNHRRDSPQDASEEGSDSNETSAGHISSEKERSESGDSRQCLNPERSPRVPKWKTIGKLGHRKSVSTQPRLVAMKTLVPEN